MVWLLEIYIKKTEILLTDLTPLFFIGPKHKMFMAWVWVIFVVIVGWFFFVCRQNVSSQ
jgi:hypothetical protein